MMLRKHLLFHFLLLAITTLSLAVEGQSIVVHPRYRAEIDGGDGQYRVFCGTETWNPNETAIIVCDMWDRHWCQGATQRVAELAPVMNHVISIARDKGVFIIHAPSDTMDYYKDHLARKQAQDAPKAINLPEGIARWRNWKNEAEKSAGYPIDHSDGGCDCSPPCPQNTAWTKQVEAIEIKDVDAISDSGVEIWNLLEARDIRNIILMGVHTNMCVLGRPFGLRNLSLAGKNVVLCRDLTDTMYNSRQSPKVSHFTGTDLMVEHVEKYVCPTIVSTAFTGEPPFEFENDKRPLVVFLSAESEYHAAEILPEFARKLEMKHGMCCEILQGSTDPNSAHRHDISGMEILDNADLVVIFVRRRALPAQQMKYLREYLDRGGPLIGLRTASHAFDSRGSGPAGHVDWPEFDHDVLGGNYHNHHGSGPVTTVTMAAGAEKHPILAGVTLPFTSYVSLYKTRPLATTTTPLLIGTIPDKESEPVAWTNRHSRSRVFYTSLGHPDDFKNAAFRRLLVNAVFWAIGKGN